MSFLIEESSSGLGPLCLLPSADDEGGLGGALHQQDHRHRRRLGLLCLFVVCVFEALKSLKNSGDLYGHARFQLWRAWGATIRSSGGQVAAGLVPRRQLQEAHSPERQRVGVDRVWRHLLRGAS